MAKDAYWFSHDSNARNDPSILDMRSKYGSQGYGWFWMLIEMLREQSDYKLKQCKCNAYAMQMNCQPDAIAAFIDDCINEYGLLGSDGEYFWSESLLRRMANKDRVSEARAQAAQKRWSNANALQMHSKPDAIAMQTDAIRREENRKEDKRKNTPLPPGGGDGGFDEFWTEYPKKVGKPKALASWKSKVRAADIPLIMSALAKQKQSMQWVKDDGQFIPNPTTYLNQRRWEDEMPSAQEPVRRVNMSTMPTMTR